MRVLVCGGREFMDYDKLVATLDEFHRDYEITVLIEGTCRGADRMAGIWAEQRGIPLIEMKAHWKFHGKKAGYLRNKWMLDLAMPDVVIAFPGGPGTRRMIELADKTGVQVLEII